MDIQLQVHPLAVRDATPRRPRLVRGSTMCGFILANPGFDPLDYILSAIYRSLQCIVLSRRVLVYIQYTS